MNNFVLMPLFAMPFYISEVTISDNIKNTMVNEPWRRMASDNCDCTDDNYVLFSEKYKEIYDQVMNHIEFFTRKQLHVHESMTFEMKNSWLVRHQKGDWAPNHLHANSIISGIVYVDTTDDAGDIIFEKDKGYTNLWPIAIQVPVTERNVFNSENWTFKPKNNQIFLFPSHLMHKVTESMSDKLRYCIAFNFFPIGTLGHGQIEQIGQLELKSHGKKS